jgi:hypothetical protein
MNYQFDLHQLTVFAIAFSATFATTCLRGFQNKNVAGGHQRLAFLCGVLMTAFEGIVILLLSKAGPEVIVFTSIGAGVGWVVGMKMHDVLVKRRIKAAKAAAKDLKKIKRRSRLEALIDARIHAAGPPGQADLH